jgi:hypothetical protein
MPIPDDIADQVADLYDRIADLERRLQNQTRTGKVSEVDPAKGLARVELGKDPKSGEPILSPWVPWKETAMGAIRTHFPPSVGEQVKLVSENGDFTDAVIDTSLPSNSVKRPHDKTGEGMIKIGGTTLLIKDGEVRWTTGKMIFDAECHLGGDGGKLLHRKGDVDSAGDTAVGSASRVYAV